MIVDLDADSDSEFAPSTECLSLDAEEFSNISSQKNSFNLLHTNINGCLTNFNTFVSYLATIKSKLSIIALTETKLNEFNDIGYSLEGYNCLSSYRTNLHGWGIKLFIHNHLQYSPIDELTIVNQSFESLFINLTLQNNEHVYIGVIYRTHETTINQFNESFSNEILKKIPRNQKVILTGDFNINLFNSQSLPTDNFKILMNNHMLFPCITEPTRININNVDSATLIDHIWTNICNPCNAYLCH